MLFRSQARFDELLRDFNRGLAEYKSGQWAAACEGFESLAAKYPTDGPTKVFLKRSRHFLEEAPVEAWDGVYTMTTK